MKTGTDRLVGYVLISMISAFVSVAVYRFLDEPERLSSKEMFKTTLVAEHELILSERLNKALLSATPTDFTEAAVMSRDAVVSVKVSDIAGANISRQSSGSGVIITSDGYIATNLHVVKNAEYVQVLLNNQRVYRGKIAGVDESTDLALIKIEAENLPFLIFGNSDSLRIGEWVMAVGNPFMLQSTVTAGIVSAKARNINILESRGIESFIQTDAAVNPGSSGGRS
jgi:serine protease Do